MNLVDRRVRRTKRLLEEALVALTLEKEYDGVTIQEITDRADVGYRTFFRHYQDKDALLKDVLASMLGELRRLLVIPSRKEVTDPAFDQIPTENGRILFEHVKANCDLYRVMLRSGPVAMESIRAFACAQAEDAFDGLAGGAVPQEIVANHIVSANFSLVRWWLDNQMPYTPEKMGEYSARLIMMPVWELVLEPDTAVEESSIEESTKAGA